MKKSAVLGLIVSLLLFTYGCGQEENKEVEVKQSSSQQETTQVSEDSKATNQQEKKVNTPEAPVVEATDIAGHPVEAEIKQLVEKGTIKIEADGKFRPDDMITRGQFIQWVYNYDSKGVKPRNSTTPTFTDLPKEHPLYGMVEGLAAGGLLTGYPDGTIKLDKGLTREEITLIWDCYQQNVKSMATPEAWRAKLSLNKVDAEDIGLIYVTSLARYEDYYKIVFGDMPKLSPQQEVTRAEAAQWIVVDSKKK